MGTAGEKRNEKDDDDDVVNKQKRRSQKIADVRARAATLIVQLCFCIFRVFLCEFVFFLACLSIYDVRVLDIRETGNKSFLFLIHILLIARSHKCIFGESNEEEEEAKKAKQKRRKQVIEINFNV